uniref:Uncharacterized protein n=1 Tax=Opuntia streptacantha TaxID=393608 RepID=A0A7C9DFG4_OPUST
MRNIGIPHHIPTLRPPKRRRIPVWGRNSTLEQLSLLGAVSLPINEAVAGELERAIDVVAGGVLGQIGGARREVGRTRLRGLRREEVVGAEVEGIREFVRGKTGKGGNRGGRGGGGGGGVTAVGA